MICTSSPTLFSSSATAWRIRSLVGSPRARKNFARSTDLEKFGTIKGAGICSILIDDPPCAIAPRRLLGPTDKQPAICDLIVGKICARRHHSGSAKSAQSGGKTPKSAKQKRTPAADAEGQSGEHGSHSQRIRDKDENAR